MPTSRPSPSAAQPRRPIRDTRPLAEIFRAQHWDSARLALPRASRASVENARQALLGMETRLAPTLAPEPREALLSTIQEWVAILAVIPAEPTYGHTDAWLFAAGGARLCAVAAAEAGALFPIEREMTFRPSALDVCWDHWSTSDVTRFFKACALNGDLPRAGCLGMPAALAQLGFVEAAALCLPLSLRQAGDDAASSRWARHTLFRECFFSSKPISRGNPSLPRFGKSTTSPYSDWQNRINQLRAHSVELDGAALAAAALTPGQPELGLERMRWIASQSMTSPAELATEAFACSPAMPLRAAQLLLSMGGRIHDDNWLAAVCALKDPAVEHNLRENARSDSERLATLQLYLKSGQPIAQQTSVLRHAAQAGNPAVLEALIHGREWTDHATKAAWIALVRNAGRSLDDSGLEDFQAMGAKANALLGPALLAAAEDSSWTVVAWLLKNGAPPAGPKREGRPLALAIDACAITQATLPSWIAQWAQNGGWGPACQKLAQSPSGSGHLSARAHHLASQALALCEAAALRKTLASHRSNAAPTTPGARGKARQEINETAAALASPIRSLKTRRV